MMKLYEKLFMRVINLQNRYRKENLTKHLQALNFVIYVHHWQIQIEMHLICVTHLHIKSLKSFDQSSG